MKKLHLCYIPFTGVGLRGGMRGDTWYKHRIEVFKNYTLKSLANQSNKDFVLWLSFRPEEKDNPLTQEIRESVGLAGLRAVFSYDGLMYVDDKFVDFGMKTRVRNFLRMAWDMWYYKEWKNPLEVWKYTWENKNKTLLNRVTHTLAGLGDKVGMDYDWVYMTRLDSDDMFHREAVNLIQSQEPGIKRSLCFKEGYIYNVQTGQVAEWNPPTNPPFHTITFPAKVFFNPEAYLAYYNGFKTHEDAVTCFDPVYMDMHKYMVSFHGKHISTDWHSPLPKRIHHALKYKPKGYCYSVSGRNISTQWESRTGHVKNIMIGKEFFGEEKEAILKDFGLV